ncbi:aminopeptidase [Longirhabdus pacifica]|uniref:aminopeptidase n=1 Tax=Longirhabdus pacifica TaxID=2305227 RepID=UPI0010089E92|nr:aminopeptidase [Longirhabdus pacifica]
MKDPRLQQLAKNIVNYSVNIQPGEKVLIHMIGQEREFVKCIIDEVYKAKGQPFVEIEDRTVVRALVQQAGKEQIEAMQRYHLPRMQEMDAYIAIRAAENANELSDIAAEQMSMYEKYYMRPVMNERVNNTKWVVMRYPNAAMAQSANMSVQAFEDFYFDVCNLDYAKMSKAMDALVTLMEQTDKVHIKGPGTDLRFSIKGIPAIKCAGNFNIPDGEVYTAPILDTVEGTISYNTPSVYQGKTFENICFRFEKGKIVEATSNDTKSINDVLDMDEGARFIGEFSLGFNPHILYPMKDTLFDEKIAGSLHFTPGQAYEIADNGNRSVVHWDLVLIQRPEFGGGEVYFDDQLIRKDGIFVHPALEQLNPENLK